MATNNELDGRSLADEYRRGDTLEAIARRHGVSLWRVRSRLLAMDVALRPPGRRPAATMPRVMSRPTAALTGEEGRRRYAELVARGEIPAVGEHRMHGTPPQAPIIRGPRSSRKARMEAERKAFAALTDDQWGEISAQLVAGLGGGQPLEDASGNTRGVRRNPRRGAVLMGAGTWGEWTGEPDPVTGYVQPPPEPTLTLTGNPSTDEALAKQRQRDEARLRSGQLLVGRAEVQANTADGVQSTGLLVDRGPADGQVTAHGSGVQRRA